MPRPARRHARPWLSTRGELRVPQITATFWVIKGLSTAMGEATSDYLVHAMLPQLAVVLGFVAFLAALTLQFRRRRYQPPTYWLAVVMVGVFGTMAADVLHVALGVPYTDTTILYAVTLAAIFTAWAGSEKTLSIHTIDSPRREAFYWASVVATFAMGTALGDFSAYTLHLGYFISAAIFAALIAIPAIAWRLGANPIACFWAAYILTRPLGASIADGLGKPRTLSGLGLGDGPVALAFTLLIAALVAYLTVTGRDTQPQTAQGHHQPVEAAPARWVR